LELIAKSFLTHGGAENAGEENAGAMTDGEPSV